MPRKIITCLTICALLLAGCKASTNERVFMRHGPAKVVTVRRTPYNARYRLYAHPAGTPTTRTGVPLLAYSLPKGSSVGFAKDAGQRLMAVAGEARAVLDAKSSGYTWTMQPDPGQIDPLRTTLLVVGIGGAVAGIAIAAVAAAAAPSLSFAAAAAP